MASTHVPRLLAAARRVCAAPGRDGACLWLTQTRVLWLGTREFRAPAVEIDAAAGRPRRLAGFSEAFAEATRSRLPTAMVLSPNRRWVLWQEGLVGTPYTHWDALSVDGRTCVRGELGSLCWPNLWGWWMPDSLHWFSLGLDSYGPVAELYSRAHPQRRDAVFMPPPPAFDPRSLTSWTLTGAATGPHAVAAVTMDLRLGRAWILNLNLLSGSRVPETVAQGGSGLAPAPSPRRPDRAIPAAGARSDAPSERVVPLPRGTVAALAEFSPDLSTIAWSFNVRGLASTAKEGRLASELWTSDARGTHMREVGYEPIAEDDLVPGMAALAWLPDSRHVSFTFNGWLYVVRVAR